MAYAFGSLVFTPVIQELQERYGSRRQYAMRKSGFSPARIEPAEEQFLAERDSFYMATVGATAVRCNIPEDPNGLLASGGRGEHLTTPGEYSFARY